MKLLLLNPVNYYKKLHFTGEIYYLSFTRFFDDIYSFIKPKKIFDAVSFLVDSFNVIEGVKKLDPYNLASVFESLTTEKIDNSIIILDSITSLEFYHDEKEILEFIHNLDKFCNSKSSSLFVLAFTKDDLFNKLNDLYNKPLSFNG